MYYDVYDTIQTNSYPPRFIPIDSSKTMEITYDGFINPNVYFTIYDDPYIVAHPATFLFSDSFTYQNAFIGPNNSIYLSFLSQNPDTLKLFKLDSTGTIIWNLEVPTLTNSGYGTFCDVNSNGNFVMLRIDNNSNIYMVSIDPSGTILFNGILPTYFGSGEWFLKNIAIDSDASICFTSYISIVLDSIINPWPFDCSRKIYKYDKYGSFLWSYELPSSFTLSTGLDGSHVCEIKTINDTLIVSGYKVICHNDPTVDPIYFIGSIDFIDGAGQLIGTYLTPDTLTISMIGDLPYTSITYLGKSINGNLLFMDRGEAEDMVAYHEYTKPFVIRAINLSTLQSSINFDLYQPFSLPANIDEFYVPYIEPDPSGNLSIFIRETHEDSLSNEVTNQYWMQVDYSGNLVNIDTLNPNLVNAFYYPYINNNHNTTFFNYNYNFWKKVRNGNELMAYNIEYFYPNYTYFKSIRRFCFDCVPSVQGKVYLDSLSDCQDVNDPPFHYQLLSVDTGLTYLFTDLSGNYLADLDSGPHTIEPIPQNNSFWYSPCFTLPLNVNAPASPNVSTGNDVPLSLLPNVHEIEVYVSGSTPNPGFSTSATVVVKNNGTVPESGIVEYWYTDSIFDFTSATPAPDSIAAGYLSWNYYNIPIFGINNYSIEFQVPTTVSIGYQFDLFGKAGDVTIDTLPINNTSILNGVVSGSYDPNDKQVWPKGTGAQGFITPQDSLLEYLIRFQNTGTDTAITVRVEDMIDTDLDLGTLQIEMASHPYTVQLQGRKLIFTFNNIMLPDSGANLAASNGFVQYTIEQNAGLPIGTEIKNIAAIYFDFNSPIITNMVTNTIDWATSVSHSNTPTDLPILKAYPNPFGNSLHLEWNYAEPLLSLTLWNLQGQKVGDFTSLTKGNLSGKVDLGTQSASLPNGIYFLKAETATSLKMLKVVKQ
jgi:hypothetical protein